MRLAHWILYGGLVALGPYLALGLYLFSRKDSDMADEQERDDELEQDLADTALAEGGLPPGEGDPPEDGEAEMDVVRRLRRDVRLAQVELDAAKEAAKEAKEHFDGQVQRLLKYIDATEGPGELPLWPAREDGAKPADDAWRSVPLADVLAGLPPKKMEVLTEAGLTTLGEMTDFQAEKGTWDWELPGIGPEWRTKIENLLDQYWAKNPRPAPAEPPDLDAQEGE